MTVERQRGERAALDQEVEQRKLRGARLAASVEEARSELGSTRTKLAAERQSLAIAEQELADARQAYEALLAAKERALRDATAATRQLLEDLERTRRERRDAEWGRLSLQALVESTQREADRAAKDRDRLRRERDAAHAERDAVQRERDAAITERETIAKQLRAVTEELARARAGTRYDSAPGARYDSAPGARYDSVPGARYDSARDDSLRGDSSVATARVATTRVVTAAARGLGASPNRLAERERHADRNVLSLVSAKQSPGRWLSLVLLVLFAWFPAPARAEELPGMPERHVRITSAAGPIHVWTPARYDASTAGIVVYVHGFYVTVDGAWKRHRLADQFAKSGLNALFIACEAPRGGDDPVSWTYLTALLKTVSKKLGEPLPKGRVVAVGHSGAHLTMAHWLDDPRLDTIVLLDARYRGMLRLDEWLEGSPARRLIEAAALTQPWSDELHASRPDALVFDRFPLAQSGQSGRLDGARQARVVYVRSQLDHMGLVTSGVAIPMLLRTTQIPVVADASRKVAPARAL